MIDDQLLFSLPDERAQLLCGGTLRAVRCLTVLRSSNSNVWNHFLNTDLQGQQGSKFISHCQRGATAL